MSDVRKLGEQVSKEFPASPTDGMRAVVFESDLYLTVLEKLFISWICPRQGHTWFAEQCWNLCRRLHGAAQRNSGGQRVFVSWKSSLSTQITQCAPVVRAPRCTDLLIPAMHIHWNCDLRHPIRRLAVNVMAPFLLTSLLLENVRASGAGWMFQCAALEVWSTGAEYETRIWMKMEEHRPCPFRSFQGQTRRLELWIR